MDLPFFISSLLILLSLSAYFSSSESALFSLSPLKIKAMKYDPDPRNQLIAQLLAKPRDLLVTVFMLNTVINILLQNVASSMFGIDSGWILRVGFPLIITLVFGEIIPKYLGLTNNISLSYIVAPTINFCQNVLSPIRTIIVKVTAPISRLLFFYLRKEQSISNEELQHVLQTSQESGVLKKEEAALVWGYLNLQETLVKELMVPREDMHVYNIKEPLSKLLHMFAEEKKSNIPVVRDDLQNVLGVMTARNYFLHHQEITEPDHLLRFLEHPYFVPENAATRALLRSMQENGKTMAIAVDEYGTVTGLVTLDDIIDTVVGNATEEKQQSPHFTRAGNNEIIASGKMELSEFNDYFKVNLDSPNSMVTLGGWLMEQLDDIPKSGTQFQSSGFLFQILSADATRIRRIYVRRLKP